MLSDNAQTIIKAFAVGVTVATLAYVASIVLARYLLVNLDVISQASSSTEGS